MELEDVKDVKKKINLIINSNILLKCIFKIVIFYENIKLKIENNILWIIIFMFFSLIPISFIFFNFNFSIYNVEKISLFIFKKDLNLILQQSFLSKIGIYLLYFSELMFFYISLFLNILFLNMLLEKTKDILNSIKESKVFYSISYLIIFLINKPFLSKITLDILNQILLFLIIILIIHIFYLIVLKIKNNFKNKIYKKMNEDINFLILSNFLNLKKILNIQDKDIIKFLEKKSLQIEEYRNCKILDNF